MSKGTLFIIGLITAIVGSAVRAFAIVWMWEWFIVPLGVVAIGAWHAWGLSIFGSLSLMRLGAKRKEGKDGAEIIGSMVESMVATLLLLGLAYLAHLGAVS